MPTPLAARSCNACGAETPVLSRDALEHFQLALGAGWQVVDEKRLEKEYRFRNFVDALAFTNRVGAEAEAQGHHPDIFLAWGKVRVTLWTHSAGGLTENDFILAARIEQLPRT